MLSNYTAWSHLTLKASLENIRLFQCYLAASQNEAHEYFVIVVLLVSQV